MRHFFQTVLFFAVIIFSYESSAQRQDFPPPCQKQAAATISCTFKNDVELSLRYQGNILGFPGPVVQSGERSCNGLFVPTNNYEGFLFDVVIESSERPTQKFKRKLQMVTSLEKFGEFCSGKIKISDGKLFCSGRDNLAIETINTRSNPIAENRPGRAIVTDLNGTFGEEGEATICKVSLSETDNN